MMKIKSIILNKYRRLFLNSIEKLEYNPDANIQVIIGRNMCGKSSLLKELTPLPAEVKKEFKDGGYKEITIEHHNSIYKLSSKIEDGKVTHSFIKDNQELNNAGNKRIQLELVKSYFKLTPDIVEILLNKNRFTTMSPVERKKWFSEMSSIDYTYPISVYNKIKSRHRDIVGGIKLATDNVVSTEHKINNQELLDKYIKDKEVLEEIKDHISSLYIPNNNISITPEENHNKLLSDLSSIERILSTNVETNLSRDEVVKFIESTKVKLEHTREEIKKTNKELDLIETSTKYGEEDKLNNKYKELENELDILFKDIYNSIKEECHSAINKDLLYNDYTLYSNIYTDIVSNVNALSEYDNLKDLTKEEIDKIKEEYANVTNAISRYTKLIELITQERDKMIENGLNKDNEVTCPNCTHSWHLHYDKKMVDTYNKQLEDTNKLLLNKDKRYKELTELLERLNTRFSILSNIKSIIKGNPSLKYIWITFLHNIDINTSNSELLLSEFNKYLVSLTRWKDITLLDKSLTDISNKLKFIEDTKKMNISLEQSRIEVLNKKLYGLQSSIQPMVESLKKYESYLKLIDNLTLSYDNLSRSITNYRVNLNKLTIELRNTYLMELVSAIKEEIKIIDTELSKFKSGKDLVENEKKKIEEYKVKEKVLKILEQALSPSEGLIAKSMNSFLNIFVEEMNEVISNIWSYNIELLPCDIDNEDGFDLDYKFKVKVDNNEIIEDVSKLSSSGQEIVDLAYRLVFSKYMGLEDMPLYSDEFGSSFDKLHRTKAYEVIDRILSSEYGQIFLICHFESLYGTLRNMDINILDPNNIELGYVTEKNNRFKIN